MTKLGITPGVHGEGTAEEKVEKDDLSTIKVDPKVFTILQPVNSPTLPSVEPRKRKYEGLGKLLLLILILVGLSMVVLLFALQFFVSDRTTFHMVPQQNFQPNNNQMRRSDSNLNDVMNMPPIANMMRENQHERAPNGKNIVDGSVERPENRPRHPYEIQGPPMDAWNMPGPNMQQRNMQIAREQRRRMMQIRRFQQAMFEQQMIREHMAREFWRQQQFAQQQAALAQLAQQRWAQQRMEQARMQRQQMEQVRMQQMEMARARSQEWRGPQWDTDRRNWNQPQQMNQWQAAQQQWHHNQQPQRMNEWANRQPQQQQPQWPEPRLMIIRSFSRIVPNVNQIPPRPVVDVPAETNTVEEQQPAVHDRIYQEMQKKSQEMHFNAPSRPIWTAITPTPATPAANYDQDQVYQENLKKALQQESQQQEIPTVPSSSPENVPTEEQKEDTSDEDVFGDIFTAMADAVKNEKMNSEKPSADEFFVPLENEPNSQLQQESSEENDFPASESPMVEDQAESSTENVFAPFGSQEIEQSAEMNGDSGSAESEMPKPEELTNDEVVPNLTDDPSTLPVIIEDRFPRIEERTTTSETPIAIEESFEKDPLAAFLSYFEQEARKMAKEDKPITDSEIAPITVPIPAEKEASGSAQVDEPEPNFEPIPNKQKPIFI